MSAFPALLDEVMRARGLSMTEVARRLDVHLTFVDKLIRGKCRPPLDRMEALATALELTGEARERFIDAGMVARLGPVAVAWMERRVGRVPKAPTLADLGLKGGDAGSPAPMGRPRERPER